MLKENTYNLYPTLSFQAKKTSFSAKILPTVALLFFFRADFTDSPDCLVFINTSEHICLLLFLFYHFLVVGSVWQIKLSHQLLTAP